MKKETISSQAPLVQASSCLTHAQAITALARAEDTLLLTVNATIEAMFKAMSWRDPYTAGHEKKSALIASAIAAKLGLTAQEIQSVYLAGLVHDIGKIAIPLEFLTKPSRLTDTEMKLVQEHANIGYQILKDIPLPWPIATMVYQHHERLDGSGYPQKLSGDQICLGARIIAVADTIEAMATHRPYRAALGLEAAMDVVRSSSGHQLDPTVAHAAFLLMDEQQTLQKLLDAPP